MVMWFFAESLKYCWLVMIDDGLRVFKALEFEEHVPVLREKCVEEDCSDND